MIAVTSTFSLLAVSVFTAAIVFRIVWVVGNRIVDGWDDVDSE